MKSKTKRSATKRTIKKVQKPMTCLQMVRAIQQMLKNASESESCKMWDILTALRGPDFDNSESIKRATTAVIRHRFLANTPNYFFVSIGEDGQHLVEKRVNCESNYHFINHAKSAFRALGLKWDETN